MSPDGVTTYLPWSAVGLVREPDHLFLLFGPAAQARLMLPKPGLTEPDALPRLRTFLTESAAGRAASS